MRSMDPNSFNRLLMVADATRAEERIDDDVAAVGQV
jgi:hypothetical protein